MKLTKKAAIACAEKVVASRHMCGGCFASSVCKVSSRFALMRYREALDMSVRLDKRDRRRITAIVGRLEKRLES